MSEQRFNEAIGLAATAVAMQAIPEGKPHDEALFRDNVKFAVIGFVESLFDAVDETYAKGVNLRDVVDELDLYVKVGEQKTT